MFTDLVFPLWLGAAVAGFWALPQRIRPWWLGATGCAFYAYYSPRSLLLVLAVAAAVWLLTHDTAETRIKPAAVLGVLIPLGVLAWFKYRGMAWEGLGRLGSFAGVHFDPIRSLYLPLAVSFFTFEFIHYAIERRRGTIEPAAPGEFFAFAMFFPTMVAGPIKRFGGFREQLAAPSLTAEDASGALARILLGLVKKVVIADSLEPLVRPLLTSLDGVGRGAALIALAAFSVRILLDFSGYSDIAIGSARLFGIVVPENFDHPYLQPNISEFWRHWHMSLTSWIFDYVYVPLGGGQRPRTRVYLNLLAVMLISGLWHGAQWHFVAWGLYHGSLLVAYRIWRDSVRPAAAVRLRLAERLGEAGWLRLAPLRRAVAVAGTFAAVTLGWGLFAMPFGRFAELMLLISGAGG